MRKSSRKSQHRTENIKMYNSTKYWIPLRVYKHKQNQLDMSPPKITGCKDKPNIVLCRNRNGHHNKDQRK